MNRNFRMQKWLWILTSVLAAITASTGIFFQEMYLGLFPPEFLPGAFPQDVITVLLSLITLVLAIRTGKEDLRSQLVIMGVMASYFYLYGIFSIERVYTHYYLLYAAVFALSFWSIVSTLTGFRSEEFVGYQLPKWLVRTSAVISILIAVAFTFLWIVALIPLMRTHDRIEFLYSIYILDLCFVMPAFMITAVQILRKKPIGILMSPVIMIMGFFVIFPLALNEWAKPGMGQSTNTGAMLMSLFFSLLMLVLACLQLIFLKATDQKK